MFSCFTDMLEIVSHVLVKHIYYTLFLQQFCLNCSLSVRTAKAAFIYNMRPTAITRLVNFPEIHY